MVTSTFGLVPCVWAYRQSSSTEPQERFVAHGTQFAKEGGEEECTGTLQDCRSELHRSSAHIGFERVFERTVPVKIPSNPPSKRSVTRIQIEKVLNALAYMLIYSSMNTRRIFHSNWEDRATFERRTENGCLGLYILVWESHSSCDTKNHTFFLES
jgi:hypothetical protein